MDGGKRLKDPGTKDSVTWVRRPVLGGVPYRTLPGSLLFHTPPPFLPGFQANGNAGKRCRRACLAKGGSGRRSCSGGSRGRPALPHRGSSLPRVPGCQETSHSELEALHPDYRFPPARDTDTECPPSPSASQPGGRLFFLTRRHKAGTLLPPGGCRGVWQLFPPLRGQGTGSRCEQLGGGSALTFVH